MAGHTTNDVWYTITVSSQPLHVSAGKGTTLCMSDSKYMVVIEVNDVQIGSYLFWSHSSVMSKFCFYSTITLKGSELIGLAFFNHSSIFLTWSVSPRKSF